MNREKYFVTSITLAMLITGLYVIILCACKSNNSSKGDLINLTNSIDPDIVLINFEEGDRAYIGNLLLKIDSCKPYLIGIDAWFLEEKGAIQDSVLMKAFKVVQNDILGYFIDSSGIVRKSNYKFGSLVRDQGSVVVEGPIGLSNFFTPIEIINKKKYEHFSLQIIKYWKPNFKPSFKANELIPINFTRTLNQFVHFNGSELTTNHCKDLKNKIVLVGYLGPRDEDKHFTPLRTLGGFEAGEPDTYGLVIIANEIRTILEYGNN